MREHDYGPWLTDVPGIQGKERRCRKCGAKEWDIDGVHAKNARALEDCQ